MKERGPCVAKAMQGKEGTEGLVLRSRRRSRKKEKERQQKNEHVSCRSICEARSNIGGAYLRDLRSSLSGFNERPLGT